MLPLLLVVSLAASAPGQRQAAQRLYDKASAAYAAGSYEKALRDFTAAYELDPATSLLFNIAQCHRKLGHWKDALSFYRSYLSERPDAVNREAVEALLEEVRAHLPPAATTIATPPPAAAPPARQISASPSPSPPRRLDAPPAPAPAAIPEPAPAEALHAEPSPPSRSHWLGVSLLAATVVCAGFAIFGAVRAADYLGMTNAQRLQVNEPNDNNWANAAVVLGVATAAGAVGTGFAW